jgi:hypothetical protein
MTAILINTTLRISNTLGKLPKKQTETDSKKLNIERKY